MLAGLVNGVLHQELGQPSGYAVLAFVTTAAIGVGTVLGSQSGGWAQRRWAPTL
ncbi:hypothetical protein OG215_37460 (plasmid) [Streptomyces globisporus]|uniref:hypothetical protein n=1 Tax=Streptomyces globisporus TaxID=1908 RepID=UPI003869400D|nr:hypothetical protein OG215_37460 [Streptomyces globisporus]